MLTKKKRNSKHLQIFNRGLPIQISEQTDGLKVLLGAHCFLSNIKHFLRMNVGVKVPQVTQNS